MQLDHLRYFIGLARAGSIARAASSLFISPQGLNKAIASIESELGVQLVTRGSKGSALTADGMVFLDYAVDAVDRFDQVAEHLAASKRAAVGELAFSVGATSYALHTVFEEPFDPAGFGSLRLQEMGPTEIADAVEAGDTRLFVTDLIDGSSLAARCRERGEFQPVFRTSFGVICHRDFPLARASLTAEELSSVPLVCYHDESIDWVMGKFFSGAGNANVLLRTSNSEQLVKYVMSKSAVSLLDSFAYAMMGIAKASQAESLRFVPVVGMPECTTGFLYHPESPHRNQIELFIDAYMVGFRRRYASYLRHHDGEPSRLRANRPRLD